jgi:putative ABC transport system substrate-binding protein
MRRRSFIQGIAAFAARPLAARAQQSSQIKLVGVLFSGKDNDPAYQARTTLIRKTLQDLGWVEGRNLTLEFRFGGGDPARMRTQAADLVRVTPQAILAVGTRQLEALARESRAIPIVGAQIGDPVILGFAESLGHPGGNVTGFMEFEFGIGGKWLETLKEIDPKINRVLALNNPDDPVSSVHLRAMESTAPSLQLSVSKADFRSTFDIERASTEFAREPNGGVVVVPDIITFANRDMIAALMARLQLPAIYAFRFYATSGGLVSYGTDTNDLIRRACSYIDRILRGTVPGDLPVQAPTKFELVINLKTARSLGLNVPGQLLARADEVIE